MYKVIMIVDVDALSSESTTPSPLDDSLSDITDVAPCRKRRFRRLGAAEPAVKNPIPEASQQQQQQKKKR